MWLLWFRYCFLLQESGEKIESMSKRDAAMFPVIASCALFGLYVFFKVNVRIKIFHTI